MRCGAAPNLVLAGDRGDCALEPPPRVELPETEVLEERGSDGREECAQPGVAMERELFHGDGREREKDGVARRPRPRRGGPSSDRRVRAPARGRSCTTPTELDERAEALEDEVVGERMRSPTTPKRGLAIIRRWVVRASPASPRPQRRRCYASAVIVAGTRSRRSPPARTRCDSAGRLDGNCGAGRVTRSKSSATERASRPWTATTASSRNTPNAPETIMRPPSLDQAVRPSRNERRYSTTWIRSVQDCGIGGPSEPAALDAAAVRNVDGAAHTDDVLGVVDERLYARAVPARPAGSRRRACRRGDCESR